MPQILFPGHRYLGPGNPIENGDPVDEDDRIAQRHDIAYEDARTRGDVRRADRVAIRDFSRDLVRTGNWHSAVGAAGLGIKYAAETLVGVQYPRLNSGRGYYEGNLPARVQSNKELFEYSQGLEAGKS